MVEGIRRQTFDNLIEKYGVDGVVGEWFREVVPGVQVVYRVVEVDKEEGRVIYEALNSNGKVLGFESGLEVSQDSFENDFWVGPKELSDFKIKFRMNGIWDYFETYEEVQGINPLSRI